MSRAHVTYGERRAWQASAGYGLDVEQPVAGYYKIRLGAGTIKRGVWLVYGPPLDPVTRELLDRSWRWMAYLEDGTLADFSRVWPACAKEPITEEQFNRMKGRVAWARKHAPDSAYAQPGKRHDPLSPDAPLPF